MRLLHPSLSRLVVIGLLPNEKKIRKLCEDDHALFFFEIEAAFFDHAQRGVVVEIPNDVEFVFRRPFDVRLGAEFAEIGLKDVFHGDMCIIKRPRMQYAKIQTMKSPDSHIVILRSLKPDKRRKIVGFVDSLTAAKRLAMNPQIKLKPFDMLIAGPVEIVNVLVMEESPLSIFIVDPTLKIRKAPELIEEVAGSKYKNWISAWESSDRADGMATMCEHVDKATKIQIACDFVILILENLYRSDDASKEPSIAYVKAVKKSKTRVQFDRMQLHSSTNRLYNIMSGFRGSLFSIVETAHLDSYARPIEFADIIRSYVPLPVVLLGKHAHLPDNA